MEVKGTAIAATVDYVREKHGAAALEALLAGVPEESRRILKEKVLPSAWYPIGPAYLTPTRVFCDLFHGGDSAGAWQIGRYSAETALTGIYKALLVFISPRTFVERGPGILTNYYRPMRPEVKLLGPGHYAVFVHDVDEPSPYFDARVGGFIERALEMSGAKELSVKIVAHAARSGDTTELHFVWR